MPRLFLSFTGVLLALSAAACGVQGSGVAAEERREVPVFQALDASGAVSVTLTVKPGLAAPEEPIELTVSGDDNLVPEVETAVEAGVLVVRVRGGRDLDPTLPLRVTAAVPALSASRSSGTAEVQVHGLDGDVFLVEASDSSDVVLSGRTSALRIESSGSADIAARDLAAGEVTVDSNGSSDVEVCAEDTLQVTASGQSDVTYFCSPAEVDQEVRESADVRAGE